MKYYLVRYLHTDLIGWEKHVNAHIEYLEQLVEHKKLIVSGPIKDSKNGEKEALLIFYVEDLNELQNLIQKDPFWYEGLVANYNMNEWDPMFGSLGKS
ncbi:YciI family protein [Anaerosinus massiliensis]|uniref:YciI family protein n=1 Tax=Massilibacillus massiliensis TaxID=1806837 RepID=UPI000DA609E4|nr:YciI family protein [Massilibacillus massiliensis]